MKRLLSYAAAAVLGAGALRAAAPAATAPARAGADASPEIVAEIGAGLPGFGEAKPAAPRAAAADPSAQAMSAHIKRISPEQFRPPHGEEVLTSQGKTELAMTQYLGKADGFDRGLLNRFTLPALWAKIPILNYLPCPLPGVTNEDRAMAIKADVDFHDALRDENDFSSLMKMEQTAITGSK